MLLKDKNAIIYGAGGSLGGAVASALAAAGAQVFLTGHNIDSVKNAASKIESAGGKVSRPKKFNPKNSTHFGPNCSQIVCPLKRADPNYDIFPDICISQSIFFTPLWLFICLKAIVAANNYEIRYSKIFKVKRDSDLSRMTMEVKSSFASNERLKLGQLQRKHA
ncbi:hypothetical protein [Pedobacter sp. V48]|uniref:hypothetical protein n=1 Tax=Pedobacter sp. V48 TaxID=509635 RepID=UPI0003E564EC|nr:hypothetical protein [Pedobacter sp. V48]ETZ20914.1 hypothetical protein N824_02055 [Pedobacter sp. V48]